MAEREAAVKLTLDDAEYIVSMRKAGDEAEKAGRKGQKSMGVFGAGIDAAKKSIGGFADMVKKATGLVTGLAAGFSVGTALKGAVELDAKFKQLAFTLSVANQKQVDAADIQRDVEQAAGRSGRRTAELVDAFEELTKATGDAEFARDVLESIGTAATATGQPIETVASLADQLHTKFGVAADEMDDVLAKVFEASTKGGPAFEEFSEVAGAVGAELLAAGLDGRQGLDFMLGALVQTDDRFKSLSSQVKGLKAVLRGLGDKGDLKKIGEALGIDPKKLINEKDAIARLRKILSFGKKGVSALMGAMNEGEEKETMKILFTDPFEKALADANASGLKGKAAINSALATLDQGIAEFGKATINGATIQTEAQERMKDPQKRLELALEQLERSFARPEIIEAIQDLSVYLPGLATTIGNLVKFAAQNPLLAGGLAAGGSIAGGFAKGAATSFLQSRANDWGSFIKASAKSADDFSARVGAAHKLGGMQVGNAIRGAGALAAVAIAGEIARAYIASKAEEDAKTTGDLAVASARAGSFGNNLEREKEELKALRASVAAAQESRSGVGGVVEDVFSGLGGLVTGETGAATLKDAQIREAMRLVGEKQAHIRSLESTGAASPATVGLDPKSHKETGRAVAQALGEKTLKVEIVNGVALRGGAAGGGRGPRSPAPAQPGGGH